MAPSKSTTLALALLTTLATSTLANPIYPRHPQADTTLLTLPSTQQPSTATVNPLAVNIINEILASAVPQVDTTQADAMGDSSAPLAGSKARRQDPDSTMTEQLSGYTSSGESVDSSDADEIGDGSAPPSKRQDPDSRMTGTLSGFGADGVPVSDGDEVIDGLDLTAAEEMGDGDAPPAAKRQDPDSTMTEQLSGCTASGMPVDLSEAEEEGDGYAPPAIR